MQPKGCVLSPGDVANLASQGCERVGTVDLLTVDSIGEERANAGFPE